MLSDKKNDKLVKLLNASKRLTIAKHLVNNSTCANIYNLNGFKTKKTCSNVFDLTKLKAIYILLRKPVLCKPYVKHFDYNFSLFLLYFISAVLIFIDV